MITKASIIDDLSKLGLKKGDTVFLRISYKAIGKIDGGPQVFLDSIINVVGEEGTILLTAFPARYNNKLRILYRRKAILKGTYAEPITGVMSKIAMNYPNACISAREDFPFVAVGKHAQYLTINHTYDKSGYWILEEAIKKFNCICLRVGGEPFIGTTHMSLSHILREKGEYQLTPRKGVYVKDNGKCYWVENNNVVFCLSALKKYLPDIIDEIKIKEGKVGDGYAIVTDMKKSLIVEENLFRNDLKNILCSNPDCYVCRTSFSFSRENLGRFLIRQISKMFYGEGFMSNIAKMKKMLDLYVLFRSRND